MAFNNKRNIYLLLVIVAVLILIKYHNKNDEVELKYLQPDELYPIDLNHTTRRLFNLTLDYVINSYTCTTVPELLAVIVVTSYFGNVETRSSMRRAFTNEELKRLNVCRVFLLGQNDNDPSVGQEAIENEADRYGDLVQGNFHEAYRNLTYKHLMGLKWASESHPGARYVIKMDDDIVIDVRKVTTFLRDTKLPRKLLAGYVMKNMVPKREPANKWFVTQDEYAGDKYPTFLSGWFYVTNPETGKKLVALSKYRKYFWIDDTYVTGILAGLIEVRHYALNGLFTVHPEFLRCCMHDAVTYGRDCDFLAGPNGGDNSLFYEFNGVMSKCENGGCRRRTESVNDTCVTERKLDLGRGKSVIENYRLK